jgi:hypothetical protein
LIGFVVLAEDNQLLCHSECRPFSQTNRKPRFFAIEHKNAPRWRHSSSTCALILDVVAEYERLADHAAVFELEEADRVAD